MYGLAYIVYPLFPLFRTEIPGCIYVSGLIKEAVLPLANVG